MMFSNWLDHLQEKTTAELEKLALTANTSVAREIDRILQYRGNLKRAGISYPNPYVKTVRGAGNGL